MENSKEVKREIMLEVAKWIVKFDLSKISEEEKLRLAKRKYDEIDTRRKLEELQNSLKLVKDLNYKDKEEVKNNEVNAFQSRRKSCSYR